MDHWKYIRHLLHLDQESLSGEMGSDGTLDAIYDESIRRYKLLLDVADGVQVRHIKSAEAKYLLTQHDDSSPIPGGYPDRYLVFAIPYTKTAVLQVRSEMETRIVGLIAMKAKVPQITEMELRKAEIDLKTAELKYQKLVEKSVPK